MNTDVTGCDRGAGGRRRGLRLVFHRRRLGVAVSVVALAALAAGASAPDRKKIAPQPYALIFGTVWNANNRPVPGVKVKIRRADQKKARWELISNSQGEFAQRVPAGTADYVVSAEVKGRQGPAAETKVHVINDERQDIGLHLTE